MNGRTGGEGPLRECGWQKSPTPSHTACQWWDSIGLGLLAMVSSDPVLWFVHVGKLREGAETGVKGGREVQGEETGVSGRGGASKDDQARLCSCPMVTP